MIHICVSTLLDVEPKKQGTLKGTDIIIIDLPGVYSLDPLTKDEAVVTNYLMHSQPNMVLNIANASQLNIIIIGQDVTLVTLN